MTGRDPDGPMRRVVDVVVSGAVAIALAPVLAGIAGLVRWRLGSPVLFRQRRAGKHGHEFDIVKFRTMRPASYEGEPDAERLTLIGRALRTVSADELPQLWNVLRGDMTLIGPRPTLPEQVARYDDRQLGRLAARPGLTGWAQVHGRNQIGWPERIELDLAYLERRSLSLDLRVLVRTVLLLLRPRGVTGPGGVNAGFPDPTDDRAP